MKQESLFAIWKKAWHFLSLNTVQETLSIFKKVSITILKNFWWLILLFVFSFEMHLNSLWAATFVVGSFIIFVATKPTDKKQTFVFFIKSFSGFWQWLFTGGIAMNAGTLLVLLIGGLLSTPFILLPKMRYAFAAPTLLLCLLPFGQLSLLLRSDNPQNGFFAPIAQSIRLNFKFFPIWITNLIPFIFLSLIILGSSYLLDQNVRVYLISTALPFLYAFYLSSNIALYLKIQPLFKSITTAAFKQ